MLVYQFILIECTRTGFQQLSYRYTPTDIWIIHTQAQPSKNNGFELKLIKIVASDSEQ